MNEIFEKMHNGELYLPNDRELAKLQMKCLDRLYDFNQTRPTEMAKRRNISRRRTIVLKASGTSAQTVRGKIIPDSATVLHHDP